MALYSKEKLESLVQHFTPVLTEEGFEELIAVQSRRNEDIDNLGLFVRAVCEFLNIELYGNSHENVLNELQIHIQFGRSILYF